MFTFQLTIMRNVHCSFFNTANWCKTVYLLSESTYQNLTWCFSDRASWIDYILITNLMHWLLFIHKIIFSSTCFEPQVLIFRRIESCKCSIWYFHPLWEFLVACRYTAWVRTVLTQAVYRQATKNSHRGWKYHMLHLHNSILLKMSTRGSKHLEENIFNE